MRIDRRIIVEKLKALADSHVSEDRRHWAVLYWKSQDKTHEQIADILDRSVQWVQRYSSRTYVLFEIKDWEDEEKIAWLEKECLPLLKELIKGDPYLFKVPLKLPPEPSKGPVIIGTVVEPEISDDPQSLADNREKLERDPPVIKIPSQRRQLPPPRRSLVETLSRYLIFGILVCLAFAVVGYYAFNFGKGFITPATPAIITQTPPAITSTLPPTDTPVIPPTATDTQIPPTPKPYYNQGEAVPLKDNVYAYLDKSFVATNESCEGGPKNFGVAIWVLNKSSDQFLLRFNSGSFHAVDDLGTEYPLVRAGFTNFTQLPGIDITVQMGNSNSSIPICIIFEGNLSLKANYVLITADWISGTEHLVFRKDL